MKRDITKVDPQSLDNLLVKVSDRDENAFRIFYELTKPIVYAYSLSLLKNSEEALDNVQDTYIKIYEVIETYKFKGKPMNWILTITRNEAFLKLRKQKNRRQEEFSEKLFSNSLISQEDKIVIQSLLEILTEEERNIVLMHCLGNMKHREIAKFLDLKLSTVLSKYHRAIKKLQIEWGKY